MFKHPNLEDLKVGDTVYTLMDTRFRYSMIRKEEITRVTPKRNKIETNKCIYENCRNFNPFIIPDEALIAESRIAIAFHKIKSIRTNFDKQDFAQYSDEELSKLLEISMQLQNLIDEHNALEK